MQSILADISRLHDIVDAISVIESCRLTKRSAKKVVHAVCFNIVIIGEASNRTSKPFRKEHAALPWKDMIAIRNKIVHDYGEVDIEALLDVIHNDLPILKFQIKILLKTLK